jgi:hypothetical protein
VLRGGFEEAVQLGDGSTDAGERLRVDDGRAAVFDRLDEVPVASAEMRLAA